MAPFTTGAANNPSLRRVAKAERTQRLRDIQRTKTSTTTEARHSSRSTTTRSKAVLRLLERIRRSPKHFKIIRLADVLNRETLRKHELFKLFATLRKMPGQHCNALYMHNLKKTTCAITGQRRSW
jgi:hypothetical protein